MIHKFLRYSSLAAVSCAVLGMAHSAQSAPPVSTWTQIGAVTIQPGDVAVLYTGGSDGYPTVDEPALAAFFGGAFLPGNGNGIAKDGSGIKATFSVNTGSVTLAYQLVTNESLGSGYDRAFVFLDGKQMTLGSESLADTPGLKKQANASGLPNAGPVTVLTITGLAPGVHVVGLGVYDTSDNSDPSGVVATDIPDVYAALDIALAQREVLLGLSQVVTRDVDGRLFLMRAEADAADEGDTTLALATSDGKSTVSGKESKGIVAPKSIWPLVSFYAAGDYGYQDDDLNATDFTGNTYVGTAGVEVRLNKHITLGLAYSHVENRTAFSGDAGSLRIRGDAITPYVSYTNGHLYAEALYSYSSFDDQVNNNVGPSVFLTATPQSTNHTVNFNIGYNLITRGHLVIGPFAAVNYTTGNLGGFVEGAGGAAALVQSPQSYDSLITRLGWQVSYNQPTSFGSVTPQLRASWDRQNLDDADTVSLAVPGVQGATLNAATGVITPTGAFRANATTVVPNRDYLNVGAGVLVNIGTRGSIIVDYEDHLFRNSYDERFASVKVGIKF